MRAIIADVRARGDAAVLEYTRALRPARRAERSPSSRSRPATLARRLRDAADAAQRDALRRRRGAHPRFHERQRGSELELSPSADGSELGQRVTPLDRVGIYVPGGKAAYPSSVLMNVIPAQVAGVREIVMVVPTPGRRAQSAGAGGGASRRA